MTDAPETLGEYLTRVERVQEDLAEKQRHVDAIFARELQRRAEGMDEAQWELLLSDMDQCWTPADLTRLVLRFFGAEVQDA